MMVLLMMVPCVRASIILLNVGGFSSYVDEPYPRVLSGQDGWQSTGTSLVMVNESWASSPFTGKYGDLPGKGVSFAGTKSNYHALTGTAENDKYLIEFTVYLSPYGTNNFGFRGVEVNGGASSYPFALTVSNLSADNYKVQALAADGSVAFDTGKEIGYNSLSRLDVVINADFSQDVYTVFLTQWTPAAWQSGTPVQTWTSNPITLKDSPNVALSRVEIYSTATGSAWTMFDDLKVAVVPEPTTLIMLVLGGLLYRRK